MSSISCGLARPKKFGVKASLYPLEVSDFPGETFRVLKEKEEKHPPPRIGGTG
jgi:hypothetical protein